MADFIQKIHLKEKAEEDLYFAKLDKKLIQALHEKQAGKATSEKEEEQEEQIRDIRLRDKH